MLTTQNFLKRNALNPADVGKTNGQAHIFPLLVHLPPFKPTQNSRKIPWFQDLHGHHRECRRGIQRPGSAQHFGALLQEATEQTQGLRRFGGTETNVENTGGGVGWVWLNYEKVEGLLYSLRENVFFIVLTTPLGKMLMFFWF